MLAALLFSAPEEKAVEMLLRPVVDDALSSGDGQTLEQAAKDHGQAFYTTLLSSSRIGLEQKRDPNSLLRSATALYESNLQHAQGDGRPLEQCLDRLEDVISEIDVWVNLQLGASEDFANVVELFRKETIVKSLLNGLSGTGIPQGSHSIWINSVSAILKSAKAADLQLKQPLEVTARADFETYTDICVSIVESGELDLLGEVVIPELGDREVMRLLPDLVRQATSEEYPRKALSTLKVLHRRGNGEPSDELLSAAYENLDQKTVSTGRGAADIVSISVMPGEIGQLRPLVEKGVLLQYFHSAFGHDDFDAAAMLSLTHLLLHPGGDAQAYDGSAQEGQNLIGDIGLNPDKYREFVTACAHVVSTDEQLGLRQLMGILSRQPNWDKWIGTIIWLINSTAITQDPYPIDEFIADRGRWASMLQGPRVGKEDFRKLIRARLDDSSFLNEVLVDDPEPEMQLIYEYIAVALLDRSRESHDQGEPDLAIKRLGETAQFVELMVRGTIDVVSNPVFTDLLASEISGVGTSEFAQDLSTPITTIIDRLHVESRFALWAQVRGQLLRAESFPNDLFFEVFGTPLMVGLSGDESPNSTMDLMFRSAEQLSIGGLRWILGFREEFADFFFIPEVHKRLGSLVNTIETAAKNVKAARSKEYEAVAKELAEMLYSIIDLEKEPPNSKK